MSDAFDGFSAEGLNFLAGLERDNSKTYFDAHRWIYEAELSGPMKSFVDAVTDELRSVLSPGIQGEAKIGKSLFRINRDTRFAKDKTPYKTYLDAIWWEGVDTPRAAPVVLFRLAPDALTLGCGVMAMKDELVARFRSAVDSDSGEALVEAIDAVASLHHDVVVTEPTRKRVPKPFAQDHPRAEFLKLDSLHVSRTYSMPVEASSPEFPIWVAGEQARFAPVHSWLVSNLT